MRNSVGFKEKYKGYYKNIQDIDSEYFEIKKQEDVQELISALSNEHLKIKVGYSIEEAILKFIENRFVLKYEIKDKDGLCFKDMSDGSKAFTLLEIILEFDNNKYPILIDQPEDDLDSISIATDVVNFFLKEKKDRQVIIVSHSSSLVVCSDCENVIVAHKYAKNDFKYTSGAFENSFKLKDEKDPLEKQGIREHIINILEGGEVAFKKRQNKYNIKK